MKTALLLIAITFACFGCSDDTTKSNREINQLSGCFPLSEIPSSFHKENTHRRSSIKWKCPSSAKGPRFASKTLWLSNNTVSYEMDTYCSGEFYDIVSENEVEATNEESITFGCRWEKGHRPEKDKITIVCHYYGTNPPSGHLSAINTARYELPLIIGIQTIRAWGVSIHE